MIRWVSDPQEAQRDTTFTLSVVERVDKCPLICYTSFSEYESQAIGYSNVRRQWTPLERGLLFFVGIFDTIEVDRE